MTLEELEKSVATLTKSNEDLAKQVKGQEEVTQRQHTEYGETKKSLQNTITELTATKKELADALAKLAQAPGTTHKESESGLSKADGSVKTQTATETLEEATASLSAEEGKVLDEEFGLLKSAADKGDTQAVELLRRLDKDPTARLSFIRSHVPKKASDALPTSWRVAPAKKADDTESLDFKRKSEALRKKNSTPPGSDKRFVPSGVVSGEDDFASDPNYARLAMNR